MTTRSAIREEMAGARLRLPAAVRSEMDGRIARAVTGSRAWQICDTVFAYMSFRGEPDLTAVIEAGLDAGKTVAVPKCADELHMEFYRIDSPTEVGEGYYGIREPVRAGRSRLVEAGERTLILLPCLAFDRRGFRLGYGRGYYDRYLAAHPGAETMITAYAFQMIGGVPEHDCDICARWSATEDGVQSCQGI